MSEVGASVDFADILRTHAGLIGRVASSYEADAARCEELRQDIAYAVWRALPNFRGEAAFNTFVARIAHNRGASHVLAARRIPASDELDEEHADTRADPVRHADMAQRRERLFTALRCLPLGARQVVSLALEGFSHGEIAQTLGLTVNNVDARLSRARKRLNELLGDSP